MRTGAWAAVVSCGVGNCSKELEEGGSSAWKRGGGFKMMDFTRKEPKGWAQEAGRHSHRAKHRRRMNSCEAQLSVPARGEASVERGQSRKIVEARQPYRRSKV